VNGKRAKIGDLVYPGDRVHVNGNALEPVEASDHIYIALNKPPGITSTTEQTDPSNIIDFVNHSRRIFPVGRLDKDSQGLIFLTSDGNIVNKILRASNNHEKEYLVTVDRPITGEFITGMSAGVPILGQRTKKCFIAQETPYIFRIILVQGLNRQIRRMCEFFGYNVTKLERIRIMNVKLKGLPQGDWRDFTPDELGGIFKLIEHSASETEHPHSKPPQKKWKGHPAKNSAKKKEDEKVFHPKVPRNKSGKNNNRHKGKFGGGSRARKGGR
jgi:23S rRNA pseudouridine2604 synthase